MEPGRSLRLPRFILLISFPGLNRLLVSRGSVLSWPLGAKHTVSHNRLGFEGVRELLLSAASAGLPGQPKYPHLFESRELMPLLLRIHDQEPCHSIKQIITSVISSAQIIGR